MSANLLGSKLIGVSFNALHLEKGNLMLTDQELTRKITRLKIYENDISGVNLGNVHKAFNSLLGRNLVNSYAVSESQFLVEDVIPFRSIQNMAIIFPENVLFNTSSGVFTNGFADAQSNQNFKDLLLLLELRFFQETSRFVDYKEPSKDEFLYDFTGQVVLDAVLGNSFIVEKIEINNVNPNAGEGEPEPEPVVSFSGAPTSPVGLDNYFTLSMQEFSKSACQQTDDYYFEVAQNFVGSGNKENFIILSFTDDEPYNIDNYFHEAEFYNYPSIDLECDFLTVGENWYFVLYDIEAWFDYDLENLTPLYEVRVPVVD